MSKHLFPGLGVVFLLTSSSAQAQTLRIDHQPVACAAVEKFPRLEARFAPADTVATARIVFQGQTADWYSVAMKAEGAVFAGVLPKPKRNLKSYRYYIEVTDKTLGTNRTADYTTSVVDSASACKGKIMAGALGSASVILQGPAGVVALPAGFASSGVVVAGSAAGSSAGAAGAAGSAVGGGGGLGTGAIVGIVAGAGAVAAGVVVKGQGSSGHVTIEGTVYRGFDTFGVTISGAVVSTSIDSQTAVSDGVGNFVLVTTGGKGQVYTLSVSAPGCQTFSRTGQGDHPIGQLITLTCSCTIAPRVLPCF